MAEKYLDKAGVQQLWNKVKERIANSSGGSDSSVNVVELTNGGFDYSDGAITTLTGVSAYNLYNALFYNYNFKPLIIYDKQNITCLYCSYFESNMDIMIFTISFSGDICLFEPVDGLTEQEAKFKCTAFPIKPGRIIEEETISVTCNSFYEEEATSYDTSDIISAKIHIDSFEDNGNPVLTITTGEGEHPVELSLNSEHEYALIEIDRVGTNFYYSQLVKITYETPNGFETKTFRTDTGIMLVYSDVYSEQHSSDTVVLKASIVRG